MYTRLYVRVMFIGLLATLACAGSASAGNVSLVNVEGDVVSFNFNFNFKIPDETTTDDNQWRGEYKETVWDFTLDIRSGPGVDFNNWDEDFDVYQFNIDSLWKIELDVSIRDEALFWHEDVFGFAGTLRHQAGENLPHSGDSQQGDLASIGFNTKQVKDLAATDLTTITKPGGLLGAIDGKFWVYHAQLVVPHPNILGAHYDHYNVYFLADVNVEKDSQSGYRILIHGEHKLWQVPEPSALVMVAIGLTGLVGGGWWRRRRAVATRITA